MTYAELIKKLEPHKDGEVFFNVQENGVDCSVSFYDCDNNCFIELIRRWGKDEIQINERL